MNRLRKTIVLSILIACLVPTVVAKAADILHRLTHGDQYALTLGTITSITNSIAEFEVEVVISGNSLPDRIRFEVPERYLSDTASDLRSNDFAVLSLDWEGDEYVISYGIYKVSSLDLETLDVLEGPLPPGDLAALQWYLNSGGVENDFSFIGEDAYVKHSDGSYTLIYPKATQLSDADSTTEPITGTQTQLVEELLTDTATPTPSLLQETPMPTSNETKMPSQTPTQTQINSNIQTFSYWVTGLAIVVLILGIGVILLKSKAG